MGRLSDKQLDILNNPNVKNLIEKFDLEIEVE